MCLKEYLNGLEKIEIDEPIENPRIMVIREKLQQTMPIGLILALVFYFIAKLVSWWELLTSNYKI